MVESLPGMEAAQGSVSSLPSIITIKIILAIIYDAAADGKIQSLRMFFFCNICRPYEKDVCIGGVIMGGSHSIITAIGLES